ncbi:MULTISPECIES: hypothetical protein [unclassified Clostridium]|uniref:hypothetical protein n=1 Tax=unclassified Clostridium TaxID=2614128 RepID=UPI00029788BA|nr:MULTISPECIES: hypothetical protein [unclassified Clostridium]EKQ54712.1 MAG: hypothetical protein A370_03063 [Clostridium sp. Maddingley MBC34-26]
MNNYGVIIMVIVMIPNIIFAIKEKNFENKYHNKVVEIIEQIGRFGSMGLMIFNIPLLEFGYWFNNGKIVYMALTGILAVLYCFIWFLYFRKSTMEKAMALAIIPTIIFLFSGIVQGNVLLIITAILFGTGHIIITYSNNR